MDLLLKEFFYGLNVVGQAQLSGMAFGFFVSLLLTTVAVEWWAKKFTVTQWLNNLTQRSVVLSLYLSSLFYSSVFIGLTFPTSIVMHYCLLGMVVVFVGLLLFFLASDYIIRLALGNRMLFVGMFAVVGAVFHYIAHTAFIYGPNTYKIVNVYWTGLLAAFPLTVVWLGFTGHFVHRRLSGDDLPLAVRMRHAISMVVGNQLLALLIIGLIESEAMPRSLNHLPLYVDWHTFEILVSVLTLLLITTIVGFVYLALDRSMRMVTDDARHWELKTSDALNLAKETDAQLKSEQDLNRRLQQTMEAVQQDQKLSVDTLVTALFSLEEGVFEWDIENEQLTFSPSWLRKFGLDVHPGPSIPVDAFKRGVLSEDLLQLEKLVNACLGGAVTGGHVQLRFDTHYGTLLKVGVRLVVMPNPYGLAGKLVGILEDRTDEMDLEMAMRRQLNEESVLSSRKTQFVSYLSHEIRTPMTIISSARALIESCMNNNPPRTESVFIYLDQINEALKTLRLLVDQTLNFIGISHTRHPLNIRELDIEATFTRWATLDQLRRHGQTGNELVFDPSLHARLFYSDEELLAHVVRHVMGHLQGRKGGATQVYVALNEAGSLTVSFGLPEWPEWSTRAGVLEHLDNGDAVIPYDSDCLPFNLLLAKRIVKLLGGRMLIRHPNLFQHELCIEVPTLENEPCLAS